MVLLSMALIVWVLLIVLILNVKNALCLVILVIVYLVVHHVHQQLARQAMQRLLLVVEPPLLIVCILQHRQQVDVPAHLVVISVNYLVRIISINRRPHVEQTQPDVYMEYLALIPISAAHVAMLVILQGVM